jgi:hypothetical protein
LDSPDFCTEISGKENCNAEVLIRYKNPVKEKHKMMSKEGTEKGKEGLGM